MRVWLTAFVVATGLVGTVRSAAAQGYEQIEFQEFLVQEKKFNNKLIAMHAVFISDEQVYSDSTFNRDYFENNGVTDKKYYRFGVQWRAQTREWLYTVIERKGAGHQLFAGVKDLAKGDKLTIYGKVKRLGDTGARGASSDPTKTSRASSSFSEVPSILIVHRVTLGWVKSLPEYIEDLGGNDELVAETIVMLTREGGDVVPTLLRVAKSDKFSDAQRANACTAVAAFGHKSLADDLVRVCEDVEPERIRTAAIVGAGRLDPEAAVEALGRRLEQSEPDEWAPYGLAELVAAKVTDAAGLADAFGDRWNRRRPDVVDACLDIAETAKARKLFERAVEFCTTAIAVDAGCGAAYHLRGKARQALAESNPKLAGLVGDDFRRAVELGEEDPDLFLFYAQELLRQGDKKKAARFAQLVLDERPDDPEARKVQAAAEGRSVAMIDSRLVRQFGATLRVPSKWEDREAYVNLKNGEVLQVVGFPEGKEPGKPSVLVQMFAQPVPADSDAAGIDYEGSAVSVAERNGHTVSERGTVALDDGARKLGWCISTRQDRGETVKYLWGLLPSNGKLLTVLYVSDVATFDAHRSTFEESLRSAAWEGEGTK